MNAELVNNDLHSSERAVEEAYLYDLSVAPRWREVFNALLDEELEIPKSGEFLDLGCGTGDYALGLATTLGPKGTVLGIDSSEARLKLARGKAKLRQLGNISFQKGHLTASGLDDNQFDLSIGDATLLPAQSIATVVAELRRVARPGALVALIYATRGSFDELHSVYWEALYRENMLEYESALEKMATVRPTVAELETIASGSGLRRVQSATRRHRYDFADAETFLTDPLIANYFLPGWLELLPSHAERLRALKSMAEIIEESRNGIDFDVALKATVVFGLK